MSFLNLLRRVIQGKARELERALAVSALKKELSARSEKEDLIARMCLFSLSLSSPSWLLLLAFSFFPLLIFFSFFGSLGNILPDTSAAPAIQAQQKELQKHMRMDSLEHKLAQRPTAEELVKEGILEKGDTVDAA